MKKRRDAVRFWAASAIVFGLALSGWSWFIYRDALPNQAAAIGVKGTPKGAATPSPSSGPLSRISPISTAKLYPVKPRLGSRIGTITLPSLKLSWPVYQGTRDRDLAKGVGHYVGSVMPGIPDNTVLSGHRMTVFNRLGELHKRDLIYVKTSAGVFTYRVRKFQVVNRAHNHVIVSTVSGVLTLTTCYPFNSPVKTTRAFIVTSDLIGSVLAK